MPLTGSVRFVICVYNVNFDPISSYAAPICSRLSFSGPGVYDLSRSWTVFSPHRNCLV